MTTSSGKLSVEIFYLFLKIRLLVFLVFKTTKS